MGYLGQAAHKVREINQRYSTPKIALPKGTRVVLMALRIYLLVLVGILFFALVEHIR